LKNTVRGSDKKTRESSQVKGDIGKGKATKTHLKGRGGGEGITWLGKKRWGPNKVTRVLSERDSNDKVTKPSLINQQKGKKEEMLQTSSPITMTIRRQRGRGKSRRMNGP